MVDAIGPDQSLQRLGYRVSGEVLRRSDGHQSAIIDSRHQIRRKADTKAKVEAASIAMPRRHRRAKTDRIDGETLIRALMA